MEIKDSLSYRTATIDDVELLTRTRVKFLTVARENVTDSQNAELYAHNKAYFEESLKDDTFAAFFAFDGKRLAGTSGVNFYKVPPNLMNKTGDVAHISNMFTKPEYRGRGVATHLFNMTVEEARRRGCGRLELHATDMGRPIYEKYGFFAPDDVMEYYFDSQVTACCAQEVRKVSIEE